MTNGWRLAGTGVWAVVDQGLFAVAGFALNLLLARWLGAAEYGVFGVGFTVFLLVGLTHTALVIEPLLVFGSGRWRGSYRAYLQKVLIVLAGVAAVGAVLLLAGSVVLTLLDDAAPLVPVLRALAWAGPCIVLQWTMRRACYVHGRPDIAATGGLLYLGLLLGAAATVRATVGLDPISAFTVMAVVSVVVAAFLAWRLLAVLPEDGETRAPSRSDVWRTHWVFGRWVLAGSVVGWLSADVFYLILVPRHGFAAAGEVRAAFNLVLPILHVITALSTVALPWFVVALREGSVRRPLMLFWGALSALAVVYGLALELTSGMVISLVYGDTFSGIVPLVAVFALLPIATATSTALATVLRAMERSRDVFAATAIAAVVAAGVGVPLTWALGGIGAVSAQLLNSTVFALAILWGLRRLRRLGAVQRGGAR